MCEFCSFGPNSNKTDRDSTNPVFSGFFSADAIEAAVSQATQQRQLNRRRRSAERKQHADVNVELRNDCGISMSGSGSTDDDAEEDEEGEDDDDGT
jgi:hypothetical protein